MLVSTDRWNSEDEITNIWSAYTNMSSVNCIFEVFFKFNPIETTSHSYHCLMTLLCAPHKSSVCKSYNILWYLVTSYSMLITSG